MALHDQKRCMGCMKLLNWDGTCPHCGFDLANAPFDTHCLPPGTFLKDGDYMVGRVLGEGGFGITYIGFDHNLMSRVAIKEYYPTGFAGRDVSGGNYTLHIYGGSAEHDYKKGLDAFLEEARILARFSGMEGIVNVRTLFQENGTAYIVMEYVDGTSVKHYVREHGKIEPELVLEMMEQPIRALQAVHEEQLVHRDVSADNFMIGANGTVTLIDFGAARYSNALDEKTRTTICKQGFSALEQYSKDGIQGPWTDVYGICATMYYMLTGIVPKNSTERIVDDVVVPLDQMKELSLGVEKKRSIMTGMAVKSSDRFQNMEVLYLAIYAKPLAENFFHNNPIPAPPSKSVKEERKGSLPDAVSPTGLLRELSERSENRRSKEKRKRMGRYAICFALALVIGVFVWALWEYRGNDNDGAGAAVNTEVPFTQPESSRETVTPEPEITPDVTPAPDLVKMPAVKGLKKEKAIKVIKKSHLRYRLLYRYNGSVPKGIVIRGSIPPGKKVEKNKEILLYISKGKKAVPVKTTPKPVATKAPAKKNSKDSNLAGDLDSIMN